MIIVKRDERNPVLKPDLNQAWEAEAVFNGCPVEKDGKVYMVYRALSLPHYYTHANATLMLSSVGLVESKDGVNFKNKKKFIFPEESWEKFGCEDPRVTKIGGEYFILYTAISDYPFRPEGIKVGLAITNDMKTIKEKHLVTPFNAKAMSLFPEKINGKYYAMLSANTDMPPAKMAIASFDKKEDLWDEKKWNKWYKNIDKHTIDLRRNNQDHVECGAPPIKTKDGWLVIYSYIQNYFNRDRLFGIEAVLLDLKNPLKVIARTRAPFLTPEAPCERYGLIPNVVFPSGVLDKGEWLSVYYGAADTTCALAHVNKKSLIDSMLKKPNWVQLVRASKKPILVPSSLPWESRAVFNPAALYLEGKVHIVYRAESEDGTSVMGYAQSKDGVKIIYRSKKPIYVPREDFESKKVPGGNSGCEDPRLVVMGEKIYMFYTAYNGITPPRVALTWIKKTDFLKQNWKWSKAVLISPPNLDNKDAFVFPEKFDGKYLFVHRAGSYDIDTSVHKELEFKKDEWLEENRWLLPRKGTWWEEGKVGGASPPIKTKKGWIMLYHGVAKNRTYNVGAVLLDLKDPLKIIGRLDDPLLEPIMDYEKNPNICDVVFPCGNVVIKDTLYVYYGAGDLYVNVATVKLKDLLDAFLV